MEFSSIEAFEVRAEAFRIMTGHMAPGKDAAAASHEGCANRGASACSAAAIAGQRWCEFFEGEVMSTWADEYIQLLDDCEAREDRLTDWERGFVDSLRRQLTEGRRPSQKQIDALDATWERATKRG